MNAVFDWLRHRKWNPEVVPELRGTNGRLTVTIQDLPCLRDTDSGQLKFSFANFGAELLQELCAEQLNDLEHVRRVLSMNSAKTVYVSLRDQPTISVQVSGQVALGADQFHSDLADCLVIAFRARNIHP